MLAVSLYCSSNRGLYIPDPEVPQNGTSNQMRVRSLHVEQLAGNHFTLDLPGWGDELGILRAIFKVCLNNKDFIPWCSLKKISKKWKGS